MRIVAGKLRHRIIKETNLPTTRETQDRIREAIFNSLGFITGSGLDLFCGSGAMALEAYSRGLDYIVFNDCNKIALKVATDNAIALGVTNYQAFNLDYLLFLEEFNGNPFDYIFLDPPYSFADILTILKNILTSKASKSGTKIIFEMATSTKVVLPENIKLNKEKIYGKKKVLFMEVL